MSLAANVNHGSLVDDYKEAFISRKSPNIQNIFALMVFSGAANTEIETHWENHASNILFNLLLWQFSQTNCLEVIYLQNLGGEMPATLYNSLSRFWLPLSQSILNSG